MTHYCIKANEKLRGVQQLVCPDCPMPDLIHPGTADEVCLTSCPYKIMEELLDDEQRRIFAERHTTPK